MDTSNRQKVRVWHFCLFQDTANTSAVGGSRLADPFGVELSRYVGLSVKQDSTAFDFWEKHEADFPILANMAKIYLGVSPGSVPVECLFSTTGLLLNAKRSSLAPYKVNMITFIHDNDYCCQEDI